VESPNLRAASLQVQLRSVDKSVVFELDVLKLINNLKTVSMSDCEKGVFVLKFKNLRERMFFRSNGYFIATLECGTV
jgi:hypothetical protein